jgi:hypothetical protein
MEINYFAVLVCGIVSMVLGSLWYGPVFGRKWMEIIGATDMDMERRKEMQKKATPLYLVSFVLALFQAYVLAYYIKGFPDASGVENSIWIFAAFVIPTVAAGSMWNNDSAKISWSRFLIQAGYYLVLFVLFGLILGMWR